MAQGDTPELLRGTLDMMILKVLSGDEEHGYGIMRRIRERSREVLSVEEGSLYPALHRLEKRGLLRSRWERSEQNRRAKFYRLTAKGKSQLASESDRWKQLSRAVGHVMGVQTA